MHVSRRLARRDDTSRIDFHTTDTAKRCPSDLARYLPAGGEHAIAASIYEKSVRDYPDKPDYRARLGNCLRSQGRMEEAIAILQPLVDAFPTVSEYRVALVDAFQNRGKYFDFDQGDCDTAIKASDQAVILVQKLIAGAEAFSSQIPFHRDKEIVQLISHLFFGVLGVLPQAFQCEYVLGEHEQAHFGSRAA
jgi:tetratricopeptide (TPR) repeat protein